MADVFLSRRVDTSADLEAMIHTVRRFELVTRGVDSLPRIEFAVCGQNLAEPLEEHVGLFSYVPQLPASRLATDCEVLDWADRLLDSRPMTTDLVSLWRVAICRRDPEAERPGQGRNYRDYRRRVVESATDFIRTNTMQLRVPVPAELEFWTDFSSFLDVVTNWVIRAYPERQAAAPIASIGGRSAGEVSTPLALLPLPEVPPTTSVENEAIEEEETPILEPGAKAVRGTKPSDDRRADILAVITEKGMPLQCSEILAGLKMQTPGKMRANLSWMVGEGILINLPQQGYWLADREVPK